MRPSIQSVAALLMFLGTSPARAAFTSGLVNLDFGGSNTPVYSGPAVLGAPGDLWNGVSVEAGPVYGGLVKADGTATDVQFVRGNTGAFDSFFTTGPYGPLLRDGFQTNVPIAFTLTNLSPGVSYDLVLYSFERGLPWSTSFAVDGVTRNVLSDGTTSDPLIEGVNYTRFDAVSDAAGHLTITAGSSQAPFTWAFNGLQIQPIAGPNPVPLPASAWLALVAIPAFGARLHRRAALTRTPSPADRTSPDPPPTE